MDASGYATRSNSTAGAPAFGAAASYNVTSATAISYLGATDAVTGLPLGQCVVGSNAARGLTGTASAENADPSAYGQVGIAGLGDIEVSEDGRYLYVVNLYDRKVYRHTLNSITNPTAVSATVSYSLPNPPLRSSLGGGYATTYASDNSQFYDGTKGRLRPFGLKYYRGKLYVGAVTTGEGAGAVSTTDNNTGNPEYTDLWAYVFEFDPATGTWAASPTLQFPLNFNRGTNGDSYDETFELWRNTSATTSLTWNTEARMFYTQAMFTDIEFDPSDGSLIIGLRDRVGDQVGHFQRRFNNVAGDLEVATAVGEVLRAYRTSSCSFELESNAKEGPNSSKAATGGAGNGQGPGGGEFYYQDHVFNGNTSTSIGTFHMNTTQGSLAVLPGKEEITVTSMDPNAVWSQGVDWFNSNTGANTRDHMMEVSNANDNTTGYAGKGCGLGDIELIGYGDLEIGNRVWNDANGNGIQDAGETVLANVTLELFLDANNDGAPDAAAIGTVTTSATGTYFFTSAPGTDATGIDYNVTLQPNQNYIIRVASADWNSATGAGTGDLAGYQLSKTDKAGNGAVDLSDNDASLSNGATIVPQIRFTTGDYGQNNHNLDFGFKPLANLGDKVWRDDDNDGIQDSGEPGVAGITVTLYQNGTDGNPGTSDDVVIGTTVTDAYGNYLFDNLSSTTNNATQYNVAFTLPSNYQFATQTNTQTTGSSNATNLTNTTGGSTAANGNDANTTTGRTGSFWLAAGESELTVDAGVIFTQPSTNSIGDKVWYDADGDGVQDTNEAGVAGVTITLFASDGVTVLATTVTDANGNYIFTNLNAGTNYIIGITLPAGMLLTTTSGTTSGNATTNSDFSQTTYKTTAVNSGAAGTQITGIDAGLVMQPNVTASLGDKVWLDLNGNNVQDAGEPGVAGVTVNLYRDANADGLINGAEAATPYATTVTDAFGNYIFNNLPATAGFTGTVYQVDFVAPSGYSLVTKDAGADNHKDSDADPSTGLTHIVSLLQGQRDMTVDAGLIQTSPAGTAKLGDLVWFDADADGVQDAGEPAVAGVTVTLYNNVGTAIATTATDANGNYVFANLAAGDYSVGFSNIPQGYNLAPTWSSDDASAANSDANPATGRTVVVTLSAGENEPDVDAGLVAGVKSGLASIGNKVWWDIVTANNIQDAGEPGVTGVTVNLYRDANADGLINGAEASVPFATTATNALGEYIFTGLAGGIYQVGFTNLPTGSNTVTQNSGANDAVDSDGSSVTNAAGGSVSTTGLYIISTGEENLTVDLGIVNTAKGSFGNKVWFDNGAGGGTANDGIQNGTEPGVAGVMVTLTNAAGQPVDKTGTLTSTPIVTTTDVNGNYVFADLTAGVSFAVKFSNLPAGFDFATMAGAGSADDNRSDADIVNGNTPVITTVANTMITTLDGGITSTRSALGNYVWMDEDGDGVQDAGEPGVAGVTVTLYRPGFGPDGIASTADDALPVASMITDQNGQYLFSNLLAGTYEAEFSTIPGGTTFTQRNSAGDNGDNTNSDAVPLSGNSGAGRTAGIVLTASEIDLTVDAGLFKPRAVIGNYVWVDKNNDGVQQATEPAASGILVSLIDNGGNTVAVVVTDANGNYLFPNVAPGTYSLSFVNLPTGTAFTTANAGGDDNTDSDVTGTTITGIVVTTTTTNLSFDAGITGFVTLPAEGLTLKATMKDSKVALTWNTISEANTDYFEIERSVSNAPFTKTGSVVKAAGSSAFQKEYSSIDDISTLSGNGQVFYRIKLYDLDGRTHYSNVAVVWVKTNGIKVWPNPFAETIQVSYTAGAAGKIQLRLTDMTGKTVISLKQNISAGTNQLTITVPGNISSGNYVLEVSEEKSGSKTLYKITRQ
ncbi:MAG: SdrD B-like domain-containing protein [Lacibacter sp.]